ncbi:hypothetical protein FI667_g12945, partial [Globisporangium splendens]
MASSADRDASPAVGAPQNAQLCEPATMWSKEQAAHASTSGSGASIVSVPVVVLPHALDLQLDVDAAALAQFDCPTFDEAAAVDLDGVDIADEDNHGNGFAQQLAMPPVPTRTNGLETSFQSLLNSDVIVYMPPVQFDLEAKLEGGDAQHPGESNEAACDDPRRRCTYRKGRCSAPRTYKRNGELHSFCALHRLRSIANQKNFDKKRRARTHSGGDDSTASPRTSHRSRRQLRRSRRRSDGDSEQNAREDDENGVKTEISFVIRSEKVIQREVRSGDNSDDVSDCESMWNVVEV